MKTEKMNAPKNCSVDTKKIGEHKHAGTFSTVAVTDKELSMRVKEAEKAGILLCMTDCEVVDIEG